MLAIVLCVICAASVLAHDPGLGTVEAKLGPDHLHVRLTLAPADVGLLVPWEAGERDSTNPGRLGTPLSALGRGAFEVRFDDQRVEPMVVDVELEREARNVHVDLSFSRPPAALLRIRSVLFDGLPRGHRQYLTVTGESGELIEERLLDARDREVVVTLPSSERGSGTSGVLLLVVGLTLLGGIGFHRRGRSLARCRRDARAPGGAPGAEGSFTRPRGAT